MIVGTLIKQPGETFPVTVDFTAELVGAETVATATVTSRNVATGADSTATICSGAVSVVTPKVTQVVHAGTDGDRHYLTFKATTSAGNVYEHEVDMLIKEV